jgi:hypothetical protein
VGHRSSRDSLPGNTARANSAGGAYFPDPTPQQLPSSQPNSQPSSRRNTGTITATPHSCGGCQQPLVGSYITALARRWHSACFKCGFCTEAIGNAGNMQFAVRRARRLPPPRMRRAAAAAAAAAGRCVRAAPCAICCVARRPLAPPPRRAGVASVWGGPLVAQVGCDDNMPYHLDCYKHKYHPECHVCCSFIPERADGKIEYKENPFWKEKYCPEHQKDGTPQCCACSRLQQRGDEWVGGGG